MNIKIKRIIFSILIIINCIVIFNFSAQDSEKSSESSGVVVNRVVNTISTVNKKVKKENIKDTVTFIVRKCAHFSIYTLLGIWLMNLANTFDISIKRKILICILFGILYASSDEFHQSFVGGRSPEVRDVCIDTCGILFGNILVIIFDKITSVIKRPKQLPGN
ncbi:MAG: VanZ family protein [Clostridia bacterium]|nr:VanZ family protein [Clostridia bacterium]